MIAYIKGHITKRTPTYVYLECNDLAYYVNITLFTYSEIEQSDKVQLFIHQHITENSQTLYGFATEEEKDTFALLISVSGVGPNTARLVLSSMSVKEVIDAIRQENDLRFKKVKGIGNKTAKQIILDLKNKVNKLAFEEGIPEQAHVDNTMVEEALSALVALGFQKALVNKTVNKILEDTKIESVEELIKRSLTALTA